MIDEAQETLSDTKRCNNSMHINCNNIFLIELSSNKCKISDIRKKGTIPFGIVPNIKERSTGFIINRMVVRRDGIIVGILIVIIFF